MVKFIEPEPEQPSASSLAHWTVWGDQTETVWEVLKPGSWRRLAELGGRHWQLPLEQAEPGAGQSATERHWTQVLFAQNGVEPWQVWQAAPQWSADEVVLTHAPSQRLWPEGQLVAQPGVPSVRQPKVQLMGEADEQTPEPLQVRAGVNVELVQEAAPQVVLEEYLRQPPLPSQVPSLPQVLAPAGVQSLPWVLPAWTLAHVPLACPVLLCRQERQPPVQLELQHTPSTHALLEHSLLPLQAWPLLLSAAHVPLLQ